MQRHSQKKRFVHQGGSFSARHPCKFPQAVTGWPMGRQKKHRWILFGEMVKRKLTGFWTSLSLVKFSEHPWKSLEPPFCWKMVVPFWIMKKTYIQKIVENIPFGGRRMTLHRPTRLMPQKNKIPPIWEKPQKTNHVSNAQNPYNYDISLYWSVHREPYNVSLYSLPIWVA